MGMLFELHKDLKSWINFSSMSSISFTSGSIELC